MRKRFFLTDNPAAGYGSRRLVNDVVTALERAGAAVARHAVSTPAAATAAIADAARSGSFDAILAAGGDGTIRLTASAAFGTGVPVGFIPLGTGNVLAHEVALPRDPGAIAAILLGGPVLMVNAARANGDLFLLMAGAGFDGRIIAALDQGMKRRLGKLAYVGPTLRAFSAGPDSLTITLDGARNPLSATWAVIANARCYGGGFIIAPGAAIAANDLLAVLFHGNHWRRLAQLLAIATGRIDQRALTIDGDVTVHSCRTVRIESAIPVPTQLDGDPFAATPLAIESLGPCVPLIVPARP